MDWVLEHFSWLQLVGFFLGVVVVSKAALFFWEDYQCTKRCEQRHRESVEEVEREWEECQRTGRPFKVKVPDFRFLHEDNPSQVYPVHILSDKQLRLELEQLETELPEGNLHFTQLERMREIHTEVEARGWVPRGYFAAQRAAQAQAQGFQGQEYSRPSGMDGQKQARQEAERQARMQEEARRQAEDERREHEHVREYAEDSRSARERWEADQAAKKRAWHEVLGVSAQASVEQIKSVYHKLSQIFHPDTETGNVEKFREVQAAYETAMAQRGGR